MLATPCCMPHAREGHQPCTEKRAVLSSCCPTFCLPCPTVESPSTGSSVPCTLLCPAPAALGGATGQGHPDMLGFILLQFMDRCCPWPRAHPPPTPP